MSNKKAEQQLEKIVDVMLKMTQVDHSEDLLKELVEGVSTLTNNCIIEVMLLEHSTGELIVKICKTPQDEPVICNGNTQDEKCTKLAPLSGISGLALQREESVKVDDVTHPQYSKNYIKRWKDTCSEIVLPLIIDNVKVRVRKEVKIRSKVIGVLNVESSEKNAFSEEIEGQLRLLSRHFAILYDRREYDRKITILRKIEQKIANQFNPEKIMRIIVKSLSQDLDFKFVNISLIEGNRIKSKYIEGIEDETLREEFLKMADHPLEPEPPDEKEDIQAHIVNQESIEVIEGNDPRFDEDIFDKFGHEILIRLFLPMIDSFTNKVIGTVEVGYPKQYRKYIYEQDIQLVLNFVNYAVRALERKKSILIDRITHEFRSPIVGIRSHASFLERRFEQLFTSSDKILIARKLNDIITDCEILLYQVSELDYFLRGMHNQETTIKKTLIFRDVIIKTINQLKPVLLNYGFHPDSIRYDKSWSRISINTNKAMINQVVYNLLMNAIKYAKDDPKQFRVEIDVEDQPSRLFIRVKDWGIGIKPENRDRIFEEGFRSREAIAKNAVGSGLGLSISKKIMQKLGGKLELISPIYRNTEFQIMLPKF